MTFPQKPDGDSSYENLIWNAPLKKVISKPIDSNNRYQQTGTPGVVIDKTTGKMETQISQNYYAK